MKTYNGEPPMTNLSVQEYTEQYCEAITENYKQDHKRSMERMAASDPNSSYPSDELKRIEDGTANLMKFEIREGKKYYKVVQVEYDTFQNRNEYRDSSVHSFVNKKTGDVLKPASWKAPAKHVRFNFNIDTHREFLFDYRNVGWAGGYLYMR